MPDLIPYTMPIFRGRAAEYAFKREPALDILRAIGWKKLALEWMRQYPTCLHCGRDSGCVPHHCFPVHLFPEFELDRTKLVTLCPPCHLYIGHGGNWKWYNENLLALLPNLSAGIRRA